MWYYVLNNTGDSNDIICTAGTGSGNLYSFSAGKRCNQFMLDGSDEIYNALNDLQVATS